jgi:serine/threonine protein kinase
MSQPTWIGRSLGGRYQIEGLLGQGGMSSVYKATDPNLKRVVAIKLIHSHLSNDTQFIQRFEEEAAAVASLRHPNIVQVYDFNSDQGVYYMVLEFVPGETLQDRLQRIAGMKLKLPIEDAIKFTLNMCDALGYAHQRGMIHRDIKPANIMLDVYGQAILMDFGIVKIIGGTSHTATGAVLGTARYISPEVIRSEPADQRSDIYSLGITLYEMLSGQAPFQSDSAMTLMMMHLNDPVPDPRSLRTDIPDGLVNILLKSLEKDRTKRYQNVAELAADLKREMATLEKGALPESSTLSNLRKPTTAEIVAPVIINNGAHEMQQSLHGVMDINQPTIYDQEKVKIPPPSAYSATPVPQGQNASQAYNATPAYNNTSQGYNPPSAQYPAIPAAGPVKKDNTLLLLLGLAGGFIFIFIIVAIAGFYYVSRNFNIAAPPLTTPTSLVSATPVIASTDGAAVVVVIPSETPTLVPSDTPTPTLEPTATYPPLYVLINSISLNGNQYVVDYETFGYTEKLPGMHIHFFFNTVPPEQAGMPGNGPWVLYGGPRPFTKYRVSQRPAAATQMCALVANSDHSVIADSGNCVDLP